MPSQPPSDKTQAKPALPPTLSDAHLMHPTQGLLRRGTQQMPSWQLAALALVFSVIGLLGGCSPRTDKVAQEAPRPRKGEPFTNSIGMQFVWIKPGTFRMGSPPDEEKREDNETPHRVTLTKGYHLGVHLVTQYQWKQVLGKYANNRWFLGKDEKEKKQLPVDNVSWEECQDFCGTLGAREKRRYRLPTEAEWEYACRAGTTTAFWWGNSITPDQANYDCTLTYGKGGKKGVDQGKTTPVDRYPPNPWGLYDMHGNLWQWCEDWYGPYREEDQTDPLNNIKGEGRRVARGGSWNRPPSTCRAAIRVRGRPGNRVDSYGCRVVLCLD